MHQLKLILKTLKLYCAWFFLEGLALLICCLLPKREKSNRAQLLAFALPPQFNSGTFRPLSFIKYANENDWKISAISNSYDEDSVKEGGRELLGEVPQNCSLDYFKPIVSDSIWRLTPKLDGDFINAVSMAFHAVQSGLKSRPSYVICSGPPFYIALAGFFVARILRARLVLDYRDEWTLCPFDFVSKTWWDEFYERRILKAADMVVYTTVSHQQEHLKKYAFLDNKQRVFPNGWEGAKSKPVEQETNDDSSPVNEKVVISYVGRLSAHADPQALLEDIKSLLVKHSELKDKLVFRFIGAKDDAIQAKLEAFAQNYPMVELIAEVSKREAMQYMQDSDILLMICEPRLATYIPGKLYDYLLTYKPILAWGHTGESSTIIENLKGGKLVAEKDVDSLFNFVENFSSYKNPHDINTWLEQYSRQVIAAKFYLSLRKYVI